MVITMETTAPAQPIFNHSFQPAIMALSNYAPFRSQLYFLLLGQLLVQQAKIAPSWLYRLCRRFGAFPIPAA